MNFCYGNRKFGYNGGILAKAVEKCFCWTWIDPRNLKKITKLTFQVILFGYLKMLIGFVWGNGGWGGGG
jgi:hypothetical protein